MIEIQKEPILRRFDDSIGGTTVGNSAAQELMSERLVLTCDGGEGRLFIVAHSRVWEADSGIARAMVGGIWLWPLKFSLHWLDWSWNLQPISSFLQYNAIGYASMQ